MPPHVERFVTALQRFFVFEVRPDGFIFADCRRCDFRTSFPFERVSGNLALALVAHAGGLW